MERWLGLTLVLLALVWLWLVQIDIPDIRTEGAPGPRAFPNLLGAILLVLGLVTAALPSRDIAILPVTTRETVIAAGTFALLILYAFLLERAGFIVTTALVIAVAMLALLRMRRWVLVASLSLGFTAGCWLIFDALLGTPLPRGSWWLSVSASLWPVGNP